jgi:hypothetical protein
MLMLASEYGPKEWIRMARAIEQSTDKMRYAESKITDREFQQRKRARKMADASRKAQRGKRMN